MRRMRRRDFLTGLGALVVSKPHSLLAQAVAPRPHVVVICITPLSRESSEAFLRGLQETGLNEGHDFDLSFHTAEGDSSRVPALVQKVVALNPAVITSQTTGLTVELKRATNSIPIVGNTITDPIGLGLISSFAHPGGNVTGTAAEAANPEKQLELLTQIVPGITRIGDLINPTNPGNTVGYENFVGAAAKLSVTIAPVKAISASEIEPVFEELKREKVDALVVAQDAIFVPERERIASLALSSGLPSINGFSNYADAGGLLSYGSSLTDRWRHSGQYVARILKGEKPGDLPFEQQAKLELVVNLKTARALRLTIPSIVLARADKMIE
jgi:putative ABC transport system substrate-binding protein